MNFEIGNFLFSIFRNFPPLSAHFFPRYFPSTCPLLVQSSYQTVQSSFSRTRCTWLLLPVYKQAQNRARPERAEDSFSQSGFPWECLPCRDVRKVEGQNFAAIFPEISLSLSRLLSFQVRKKRGAIVTTVNFPHIRTSRPLISILNGIRKVKDATKLLEIILFKIT